MRRLACVVSASLLFGCSDWDVGARCETLCTEFSGLGGPVRIHRDDLGIAHVYASSDADVYFGSGYAQASDRLFQMDLARRRAWGRRAEVLGPSAAEDDELVRTMNIPRWGRVNAETMEAEFPEEHALFVAWIAGVNQRIDEVLSGQAPLPDDFATLGYLPEPWTAVDPYAIGKLVLFGNANQIEFDLLATILRDYFPSFYNALPVIAPLSETFIVDAQHQQQRRWQPPANERPARALPPDAPDSFRAMSRRLSSIRPGASNNWAVDGRFSENGRPLLAGDPHQPLRTPSVMWAHHMNSFDGGGTIDVVGFSFVGSPTVQLGHNRDIAWTATTTYADTMDLWSVEVADDHILFGGEQVAIERRTETIEVAGEESRTVELIDVPGYGVLLPENIAPVPVVASSQRILFGWTGFAPTREPHGFVTFNRAADLETFERASDGMELGSFNFIAASKDGVSFRSSPRVPIRVKVSDLNPPSALLDGADPTTHWTGEFLSQENLPHSRAEERGFIGSANNDPYGFTKDGRVQDDPFYFGVYFDPGSRAARIEQELTRLTEERALGVEDMQALQTDTYTVLADILLPELFSAWEGAVDDGLSEYAEREDLARLISSLQTWDRHMVRDSGVALVFHAFLNFVTFRVLGDDLSIAFDTIGEASPIYLMKWALITVTERFESSAVLMQEGKSAILLAALDDAAGFASQRFGTDDPHQLRWSDVHATHLRLVWPRDEEGPIVATDGADGTINVSAAPFLIEGAPVERHLSSSGSVYRMVVDFDDAGRPRATGNFPPGNVADPASPFHMNTLEDWKEGRYVALPFEGADSFPVELVLDKQ